MANGEHKYRPDPRLADPALRVDIITQPQAPPGSINEDDLANAERDRVSAIANGVERVRGGICRVLLAITQSPRFSEGIAKRVPNRVLQSLALRLGAVYSSGSPDDYRMQRQRPSHRMKISKEG